MIPKTLLQTSKHPYPQYLNEMWKERTDDSWKIEWFSDDDIFKFFDDNPLPEFPKIKEVFNSFIDGGHKADLFRYYYLYLNGGFFVDADCMIHVHMNEIYSAEHDHILVFADVECNRVYHPQIDSPVIFNGLMGCEPKSKIIYDALVNAYKVKTRLIEKQRLYFTYMLYVYAKKYEDSYKIKWLNEIWAHTNAPNTNTIDDDQRVIASHYFRGEKIVPHTKMRPVSTFKPLTVDKDAMLDVTFFTTFNDIGYKVYGRAWIKTFINVAMKFPHLRAKIYYEKFEPDIFHPSIEYRKFSEHIPHHAEWKMKYSVLTSHLPYTKACTIRFSHKAFVMQHMWETSTSGYAIWLDGDCVFKDYDFSTFPYNLVEDKLLACQVEICANSTVRHVESGIVILNCSHPDKAAFIDKFKEAYELRNVILMPNDAFDVGKTDPWEEYGPYDGFMIHKSLMESGVDFIDLNEYVRDYTAARYTGNPDGTFFHPELNIRFIHNIGHDGKNRYVQVNAQLDIDRKFLWDANRTYERLTYTNLQNTEYSDIIEITSPIYDNKTFPLFIHNPIKDRFVSFALCREDVWEPRILKVLIDAMKSSGLFVDIGANIGWHTKVVQTAGYDVIAFEPQPNNFKLLEMNCKKEGTILYDLALGETAGEALIFRNDVNYGDSYIADNGTDPVKIVTLDEIINKELASRVNAVKMDVQGAEINIIKGGKQFFESLPKDCVIVMEVNPFKLENELDFIRHMIEEHSHSYVMDQHRSDANSFDEAVEQCRFDNGEFDPIKEFDLVLIK